MTSQFCKRVSLPKKPHVFAWEPYIPVKRALSYHKRALRTHACSQNVHCTWCCWQVEIFQSALYYRKRALYYRKRALYYCKRARLAYLLSKCVLYMQDYRECCWQVKFFKGISTHKRGSLFSENFSSFSTKKPYVFTKEPYILANEPYIPAIRRCRWCKW